MCLNLLWNPNKAVDEALHNKNSGRSFLAMVSSLVFGLGALNIVNVASTYFNPALTPLWQGQKLLFVNLSVLGGLVALYLLFGILVNLVMKTLGGKGSFYAGFTSNVYSGLQMLFGALIASALFLFYLFLEEREFLIGVANLIVLKLVLLIALVVLLAYWLLSCSTHCKLLKDLYSTNFMTVFLGLLILCKGVLLIGAVIFLLRNKLV